MPVRVVYELVGDVGGFAFDTPTGCTLVLDPRLSAARQRQIAAELLTDEEITEILIAMSA